MRGVTETVSPRGVGQRDFQIGLPISVFSWAAIDGDGGQDLGFLHLFGEFIQDFAGFLRFHFVIEVSEEVNADQVVGVVVQSAAHDAVGYLVQRIEFLHVVFLHGHQELSLKHAQRVVYRLENLVRAGAADLELAQIRSFNVDFSRFEEDESDAWRCRLVRMARSGWSIVPLILNVPSAATGCRCDGRIFGIALHQEYGVRGFPGPVCR